MLRDNPFFHKWLCGNRRLSATLGRHIPGKAISLYYSKTYLLRAAGYAQRRLTAVAGTPYFQGFLVKDKGKIVVYQSYELPARCTDYRYSVLP